MMRLAKHGFLLNWLQKRNGEWLTAIKNEMEAKEE